MRVRIKKLNPEAVVPRYAHFGDAAVDLVAARKWEDDHGICAMGRAWRWKYQRTTLDYYFQDRLYQKRIFDCAIQLGLLIPDIVEK